MELYYTKVATKDLEAVPRAERRTILDKLDHYVVQPTPLAFAHPLSGHHGFFRFRISGWRVVVEPRETLLIVHIVDRRKDVYRRLR